jgi:hypothetical protein
LHDGFEEEYKETGASSTQLSRYYDMANKTVDYKRLGSVRLPLFPKTPHQYAGQ